MTDYPELDELLIKFLGEAEIQRSAKPMTLGEFIGQSKAAQSIRALMIRERVDELKNALYNFVPETKNYYKDPVQYLEDRIKILETQLSANKGDK